MTHALLYSRAPLGIQAREVRVETHLAPGLPAFTIVGMGDTAVRESRDRVRSALVNSGFEFPQRRITVSLAPALERAASALPADDAERIRPANGDPHRLLSELDAPGATRLLEWLLHNEPEAADELADAWAEEEAGVAVLVAVDGEGLPKPARKTLRRLRHRLRRQSRYRARHNRRCAP